MFDKEASKLGRHYGCGRSRSAICFLYQLGIYSCNGDILVALYEQRIPDITFETHLYRAICSILLSLRSSKGSSRTFPGTLVYLCSDANK